MYYASVKVLNPINKDFTMFTLRSLTADDINTPASKKEAIFEQLGESIVPKSWIFLLDPTVSLQQV